MVINVKENLCPQNHPCPAVHVCPVGALTQRGSVPDGFEAPIVDLSKCTGCGKYVRVCPTGALTPVGSERIVGQAA